MNLQETLTENGILLSKRYKNIMNLSKHTKKRKGRIKKMEKHKMKETL